MVAACERRGAGARRSCPPARRAARRRARRRSSLPAVEPAQLDAQQRRLEGVEPRGRADDAVVVARAARRASAAGGRARASAASAVTTRAAVAPRRRGSSSGRTRSSRCRRYVPTRRPRWSGAVRLGASPRSRAGRAARATSMIGVACRRSSPSGGPGSPRGCAGRSRPATSSAVIRCVVRVDVDELRRGAGELTASAVAMNEFAGTMTSSPRADAQRAQRERRSPRCRRRRRPRGRSRSRRRTRPRRPRARGPS